MDWKDKLSDLYGLVPESEGSVDKDIQKEQSGTAKKGTLRVELDRRKGKAATLISEFDESREDLKALAKLLKVKCSAGGSVQGNEVLIQGDFRTLIASLLEEQGYKVRRINFK